MWVTKLLISPVKKRIFCPKTTKFGPKLAFLVILGQAMQAYSVPCWWLWRAGCSSQDTYLLYNNCHHFQCGLGPSRHRRCCQGHQCPLHHYSLQDYWYSGRIKWKSTNAEICMRGNAEVCIRGNKRAALRVISFSHQLNGCSPSI